MKKSRKATLLRVLEEIGEYPGIDVHRTPGEDAAVKIALRLIARTSLRDLDSIAKGHNFAEPFWSKQW